MNTTKKNPIILFDGVCKLCNKSVIFILKRDHKKHFKFASLQSNYGNEISNSHLILNNSLNTIVLLENNKIFIKSTAILRIIKHLGIWKIFYPFIYLPLKLRDKVYDFIATNRYNWFGKKDYCSMPDEKYKSRFIDL